MRYSAKSFNPELLPALLGALQAVYPKSAMKVRRALGDWKDGTAAEELLRLKWETFTPFDISVETPGGIIKVELREFWDLFLVDIEGTTEAEHQKLHDLVRGTLGLSEPSEAEIESDASLYSINRRILRVQQMVRDLPSAM